MLLKDFGDYGNAGARVVAQQRGAARRRAACRMSMETFTPGERFFTLTQPRAGARRARWTCGTSSDAFWRHFLHGKPMPIQEHPESILYNFLATPRNNVPRWYLEGSAVFFETWMAGGLGRAQGGYDEMVWRAKVRDNDKFYSPLGLESEGIAVDFQVGVNDYLYGTRFISYLALTYGPDKVVEWLRRRRGQQGLLRRPVQACVRPPLDDVWNDWIAFEHEYPEGQPRQARAISADRVTPAQPARPRLDLARLRRRQDQQPDRRLPLSRDDRLHRPHGPCHRQADQARRRSRA